jgi:hypothetical protein
LTVKATKTTVEGGTDPGACSDVKPGVRAGASGPRRTDGGIDASHVKVAK